MVILIIYIIFAVINIIIGLILNYINYNKGKPITLNDIYMILLSASVSIFGTMLYIVYILNLYSNVVILQKKK